MYCESRFFLLNKEFLAHDYISFPKNVGCIQNIRLNKKSISAPYDDDDIDRVDIFLDQVMNSYDCQFVRRIENRIDGFITQAMNRIENDTDKDRHSNPKHYIDALKEIRKKIQLMIMRQIYSRNQQASEPIFSPRKLSIDAQALECFKMDALSFKKIEELTLLQPDSTLAKELAQEIIGQSPKLYTLHLHLNIFKPNLINYFTQKKIYATKNLKAIHLHITPNMQEIEDAKKEKRFFIDPKFSIQKLVIKINRNNTLLTKYPPYYLVSGLKHNISIETFVQVQAALFLKEFLTLLNLKGVQHLHLDFYHGQSVNTMGLQGIKTFLEREKNLKSSINIRQPKNKIIDLFKDNTTTKVTFS